MSGITTGIGLISGMNIADLVDQLMAIEAKPRQLVEKRNAVLQSQQVAFQDVNAKLLALRTTASSLTKSTLFGATTGASSNESVLTVTSGSSAVPGNYAFTVAQLVSAQQSITRGFADTTSTTLGAGTLTFERGEARLDAETVLSDLNGGDGVQRGRIRITDRSGSAAIVDLSSAISINDVIEKINGTLGISVRASVDGDALKITDLSGQTASDLVVADIGSTTTATSLGLAGSSTTSELTGQQINQIGENTLLNSLNDGNGVRTKGSVADFRITTAGGGSFDVNLGSASTVGDVIDAIDTASGGSVTAAVGADGVSLVLTDTTGGGAGFAVTALNGSGAATDLGILGSDGDGDAELGGVRLRAGLNSKLTRFLNGGSGVGLGEISITNRNGVATNIDLAGATSISGIIDTINAAGAGVEASLNQAGNGIKLTDTTGGTADITVADVGAGVTAANLNLAGTFSDDEVDSGNLQFQYITEATRLDALGVTRGQFRITDSSGASATVDLTQGNEVTIADVISEINSRGLQISAQINATGDGILINDTGPGAVAMKIEEVGSTTAADLGLLQTAANPGDAIDGSFEKTVTIEATDTLATVATKIGDAKVGVTASIINDGSAGAPYRLIFSAKDSGKDGAFVFDDGGLGLGASTLSEAQDAVVFFGSSDPARALAITSSSNTLENVIPGATVQLQSTSASPVQVTISEDRTGVTEAVKSFVTKFNELVTTIDKYDAYDSETQQRGLLLGDTTITSVRRTIYNSIIRRNTELTGQYQSLSEVGIRIGAGAKIEFNESKFAAALANDPDAVEDLFSFKQTGEDPVTGETETVAAGIGVRIDEMLQRLTDSESGAIQTRVDSIDSLISLNKKRIEQLNTLLESKRVRLTSQFIAMEKALAQMQSQSQALASFQPMKPLTNRDS